jgi:hypothetical protein
MGGINWEGMRSRGSAYWGESDLLKFGFDHIRTVRCCGEYFLKCCF